MVTTTKRKGCSMPFSVLLRSLSSRNRLPSFSLSVRVRRPPDPDRPNPDYPGSDPLLGSAQNRDPFFVLIRLLLLM